MEARSGVHLVVRNVYTPSQSLALCVEPDMLVRALKRRLCLEFPSNPCVSSQKLIFGGKICRDDESLAQLLVPIQSSQQKERRGEAEEKEEKDTPRVEPVVFHLLVSSTGVSNPKNDALKTPITSIPTSPRETTEALDSPRPRTMGNTGTPSATRRDSSSVRTAQSLQSSPLQQPSTMTLEQHQHLVGQSVLMQQQAMTLQQIQYLEYLLMQQRHLQSPTTPPMDAQQQPFGAHFAPPYGQFYGMMPPHMYHARQQEAQVLPPTRAHVPAVTQARVERQNRSMLVEMGREVFSLLDFRMALKMAFMIFIIGQDMPTDRILMLGVLSFISYLHITGIFTKIYEVYNRHHSVHDNTRPNAPANLDAPGAAAAAGAAIANRCGMLVRVLRISADRGFVQDVKYFVVGLLLSLVPAWHPQPIQGAAPMRGNGLPDDLPIQEI